MTWSDLVCYDCQVTITRSRRSAATASVGRALGFCYLLLYCACAAVVPLAAQQLPVSLQRDDVPLFWRPGTEDRIADQVEAILATMSPSERVAQTLLLGWNTQGVNPEILRWIAERGIGGVKVFGWNTDDLSLLAETLATMQRTALASEDAIPLFTATDQEGGWVRHVRGNTSITPGNMAIGATGLPYDARESARFIGQELRALGINMNFAPTVDVYINPEAHVIGPRAFSADPVQSGLLGIAYYRGLEETRVIATGKHFPGHGAAAGDSHGMLPRIDDDLATIWERDLVPFRMLVREGVPALLSGHLSFPDIDGNETPASLSPVFKTDILRDRMQFEGIVVTDDMHMEGALVYGRRRGWSFGELVRQAIMAGNDLIMLSVTPEFDGPVWNTLITSYRDDPAFRARVDESVRRILRIKLEYLAPPDRVPLLPDPNFSGALRTSESQAFFGDQAARSVTMVRNAQIPFEPQPGERVLLAGKYEAFFGAGAERYPGSSQFRFRDFEFYQSSARDRSALVAAAAEADRIVFLLSDPASLGALAELQRYADRIVVMSTLTPIYFAELPWVSSAVAIYGTGIDSFRAGFAVLAGDFVAGGQLPVNIETQP